MINLIHDFFEKHTPECIPFPATRFYTLFARSRFMRDFYREVAIEVAGNFYGGKILDVGTGLGYLPILIARLVPKAEVVGIDLSSDMIRMARKNAEKANMSSRVRFMVEDANNMSFEDSLFDLIISTGSLHHWKKPLRVINEIYRVLKQEREAWIYDLRRDAPEDVVVKKLSEYGYGKLKSIILYNIVKIHSGLVLDNVLEILKDKADRFEEYRIEENWHSYPVLKIRLLKISGSR